MCPEEEEVALHRNDNLLHRHTQATPPAPPGTSVPAEEPPRTPSFRRISLTSTPADNIGGIADGAAEWDQVSGVWTVRNDHPALPAFAAFMTPGQIMRCGIAHNNTPDVEETAPPSTASSVSRVPSTHRPQFNLKCCSGVDAAALFDVEMHTLFLHYPTHLHSGPMQLGWHPPSSDGILYSKGCAVTLTLDGPDVCRRCDTLLADQSLQRIAARANDPLLHRSTVRDIFLTFEQMQLRQRAHAPLASLLRLRVFIGDRRVEKLLTAAGEVMKQMLQLLARNDIPRLRVLLSHMVRNGRSVKSIIVKLNKAIDGT